MTPPPEQVLPTEQNATKDVILVCGAPGSGKSTYVQENIRQGDLVVDLDTITSALSGSSSTHPDYSNILDIVLAVRDTLYSSIKKGVGNWKRAFVITSTPDKSAINSLAAQLNATVHWMNTSEAECRKRIAEDSTRNDKELFNGLITEWFKNQK